MNTKKIALVTGGSRGLGKDMALRLGEKGFGVILTYNAQKDDAAAVVASIEQAGGTAIALQLNMEDLSSYDAFLQEVTKGLQSKWGVERFDCLINNAGMGQTIPFAQATEADFDRFMNVHFKGVYFLTQKSVAMMNDGGRIINISTGTTRFCVPGYSIYASMKGGIEIFTRYLAKELGPRGFTANVVAPGPVETDFNNASIRNNPQMKGFMATMSPLGRVGAADDLGGVIAFLCGPDAGWINGQRIEVSGGINI
jgi:NAD(P)-dependent dehydrogenase (short-subunit alcohol dehydrogenase family)